MTLNNGAVQRPEKPRRTGTVTSNEDFDDYLSGRGQFARSTKSSNAVPEGSSNAPFSNGASHRTNECSSPDGSEDLGARLGDSMSDSPKPNKSDKPDTVFSMTNNKEYRWPKRTPAQRERLRQLALETLDVDFFGHKMDAAKQVRFKPSERSQISNTPTMDIPYTNPDGSKAHGAKLDHVMSDAPNLEKPDMPRTVSPMTNEIEDLWPQRTSAFKQKVRHMARGNDSLEKLQYKKNEIKQTRPGFSWQLTQSEEDLVSKAYTANNPTLELVNGQIKEGPCVGDKEGDSSSIEGAPKTVAEIIERLKQNTEFNRSRGQSTETSRTLSDSDDSANTPPRSCNDGSKLLINSPEWQTNVYSMQAIDRKPGDELMLDEDPRESVQTMDKHCAVSHPSAKRPGEGSGAWSFAYGDFKAVDPSYNNPTVSLKGNKIMLEDDPIESVQAVNSQHAASNASIRRPGEGPGFWTFTYGDDEAVAPSLNTPTAASKRKDYDPTEDALLHEPYDVNTNNDLQSRKRVKETQSKDTSSTAKASTNVQEELPQQNEPQPVLISADAFRCKERTHLYSSVATVAQDAMWLFCFGYCFRTFLDWTRS